MAAVPADPHRAAGRRVVPRRARGGRHLARRRSPWCWWSRCATGASSPRVVDSPDREVFLLKVLGHGAARGGVRVGAAGVGGRRGVPAGHRDLRLHGGERHRLLEPLRDLFAAVFFVVFGLNTEPVVDPAGAGLGGRAGGRHHGDEARDRLVGRAVAGHRPARPGPRRARRWSRTASSRSSSPGSPCRYAAVPNELAALATAYVLLMAVLGPIAARVVEPVTRWVRSKVPVRAAAPSTGR